MYCVLRIWIALYRVPVRDVGMPFSSSLTLREVMELYGALQTFWRTGRRFRCQ